LILCCLADNIVDQIGSLTRGMPSATNGHMAISTAIGVSDLLN